MSLEGTPATGVTVVSSTSISAMAGAHAAGSVSVVVTNSDGQSGTLSQGFTYVAASNPAPTVSSITPNSGTSTGGTNVTVIGTGFLAGATLTLGGTPATNVNISGSTSITATTAAHAGGAVDVVVTNADKQSGIFPSGYTYTSPVSGIGLVVPSGDPSSATITAGQTASYTLSIQGVGMSGTASLSCSGAPKGATCTVPPSQSFSASAPAAFNVTVTTTARTLAALHLSAFTPAAWFLSFGMLGIVAMPGIRKSKRPLKRYLRLAPLTLLLLLASCGGGAGSASSQQPTPNPNGTPAGTYALKVTAVSGNSTQATSLTLVVQ